MNCRGVREGKHPPVFTSSPPEGPEDEGCAAVLGGVCGRQQLSLLLPLGKFLQDAEETLHAQGEGQAARPIRERYRSTLFHLSYSNTKIWVFISFIIISLLCRELQTFLAFIAFS